MDDVTDSFAYVRSTEYFCRVLAQKQYELTNHLGNVLATVLDRKTGIYEDVTDTLMYYEADVVTATMYYPFGMSMMAYSNEEFAYSYGMNTQEKDDEIYGKGNSYSAEYWQYDARLGRRWNVDPFENIGFSSYLVLGNNPILYVDNNGDDWFIYCKTKKFLGIVYGHKDYELKWLPSNSVLFDKEKEHWYYLGESLNLHRLHKFINMRSGSNFNVAAATGPLVTYHAILNKKMDKRLLNGYAIFGVTVDSKTIEGLHSTVKLDYGTDMSKVFVANNNVTIDNFYSVIMYSFLTGKGPENFYFGPDHEVSKSLENSMLVKTALDLYLSKDNDNKDANKIKNGEWISINTSFISDAIAFSDRGLREHNTIFTPEHLIGSAEVQITESEDGEFLIIRIWNTTSWGSGAIDSPRLPRPGSATDQPYTNVSQSYEIRIPKPKD